MGSMLRIALAQLDPTVGDLAGNADAIVEAARAAASQGANLMVTPELSVIGYPPRDLLRREGVIEACERAAETIAARVAAFAPDLTVLLGHPRLQPGGPRGVRNSMTAWRGGERIETIDKRLLPGYDVFDEDRYFDPAPGPGAVLEIAGVRIGVVICEDLWQSADAGQAAAYAVDPVGDLLDAGIEVLVAAHASPFVTGKESRHARILEAVARRGVHLVSVNQVGANDDLVFDGRSRVIESDGSVSLRLPAFETGVNTMRVSDPRKERASADRFAGDDDAEQFHAISSAIAGYFRKTGHRDAVVGISGGIDSALVAAIAVAALGPEHVHGLLMPSRFSSGHSISDAEDLAERLGIGTDTLAIEPAHAAFETLLRPPLGEDYDGLPDENVQARIRGLLLMAWTNARGSLLLATSNKAELAVGYSTLYGDMCGALAPIGDLVKGRVVALCRWMNAHHAEIGFDRPPIPESTITKPPSAELRPDQFDTDSLPEYSELDAVVEAAVDRDVDIASASVAGAPDAVARRWAGPIDRSEYKRFQGSVIPKLTARTFGPGRPMPIVMRWRPIEDGEAGD